MSRAKRIQYFLMGQHVCGVVNCIGLISSHQLFKPQKPSSNPAPPLQNSIFPLGRRRLGDESRDSLYDSPGGKAAHRTTQHLQAWTCMDRQDSQSNWPHMRKTLGKPGFRNGEDRTRTTNEIHGEIEVSKRGGAESDARRETGSARTTDSGSNGQRSAQRFSNELRSKRLASTFHFLDSTL